MEAIHVMAMASSLGAALSGLATATAVYVAYKVHQSQKLLAQRQLLIPLWDHMATLTKINHLDPVTPDIIKVVNTLELVALCCEGGMIDEGVIKRTFRDQFTDHYESVMKCQIVPGFDHGGDTLLKQNRAATQFYRSLEAERLSQDSIKKL
ncbi:hypothetical protein [Ectopseudomonas alcaliphila]|uniref:Fungal N-terminal domain-containing protein n=1 Tax=Ectopseudomonas alcaliphila TaxID=101564 RepID=A0ABU4PVT3_9GAMM|nr:hypothetical protein [Pseudomonas alcaliphila]MDX5991743.1 hypothetical protein [Pseudomonas alcaliphila]